jgi:hypothetical protein
MTVVLPPDRDDWKWPETWGADKTVAQLRGDEQKPVPAPTTAQARISPWKKARRKR